MRAHYAHRLAAQIFYFLRDVGHHHQHHDPSTDTIVDLFPFDGKDDLSWRQNILYGIYRTIIQYKRNPRNKQFHASLGLLAYASTFQEVCKQELPELPSDPTKGLPYFHDQGLERSLQSLQSVNHLANDEAARRRDIIQTIVLWVVGVTISVVGILQIVDTKIDKPSALLMFLGRIAVQHTEWILALVIVALLAAVGLHSERGNPRNWRIFRNTFRLMASWPRATSGGAFIGAGIAFLVIVYLIVRPF